MWLPLLQLRLGVTMGHIQKASPWPRAMRELSMNLAERAWLPQAADLACQICRPPLQMMTAGVQSQQPEQHPQHHTCH